MQQRSRLKKYFSVFCIYFFINEILVHRTNTVAPAAVAVPIAYDIAMAGAAAIGAIYSAYLVSRLSDDLLRIHSQSLPAVAQELRTVYPVTPEVRVCTPGDIEHELENVIGTAAFKAPYSASNNRSPEFEQEIKDKIRTEIISPVVARTAYISSSSTAHNASSHVPVSVPSSPIDVSYQPGAVRVDLKHINTYASISLSNGETLSPLKQQLIQQDQARAVDAAVAAYVYEHSPAYRNDLLARFEAVGDVLYDTNRINPVVRIYARLTLPHLQLEEPLNYMLQKVVDELIPLYFDTNGKLVHLERDFGYDRQFSIAKFLRNGTSDYYYRRQIDVFNLHHVIEHENSIGVAIKNNFRHIFTGRWLPNMRYPADIRNKISRNGHNENIKRLLYYCNRHNFIEADNFIKQCNDPIYQKVYTECYKHYIEKYCDDYGIRYRYSKDPYWTRLSHKVKQEIAKDIHAITEQNAALATRSIQKNAMQNAWQISDDVPTHVHHALYDLIEYLGTGPQFVAKIHEIVARYTGNEREELVRALFLPSGFLKDFSHFDEAKLYDFPQTILDAEHAQDLKRINELLYSAHAYSGTEQSYCAFDELGKIYSCYKLPSAVVDLEIRRDHIESEADSVFEELSERMAKAVVAIKQYNQNIAANEVYCFTAQKPEDQQPMILMQNSGGGGGGVPNGPGGPGGPDNQPPDPDDDEEIDLPEYPKDPNDWPDQKWEPVKKNWSTKRSYVYLKFIGDCCLSIGLSAIGLPYSEFMLAFNLYKNVPGFLGKVGPFYKIMKHCLTKKVTLWEGIKGIVYEIKVALKLSRHGEKIIEFGRKIPGGELDIITNNRVIECKTTNWMLINNLSKYKETFGRQLKYAQETLGKKFAVFSENPMPAELRDWCIKKGIEIIEG